MFLPFYFVHTSFLEFCIDLAEWFWPEESSMCWERAWVWWFDNVVFCSIDEFFLTLCEWSPEDKDDKFSIFRYSLNDKICECSPTKMLVTRSFSELNREYSIEEEYTLARPVTEITTSPLDTKITLEFFVDISETRWQYLILTNTKSKSICNSWSMIGVLSENDNFDLIERGEFKCSVDLMFWWCKSSRWEFIICSFFEDFSLSWFPKRRKNVAPEHIWKVILSIIGIFLKE